MENELLDILTQSLIQDRLGKITKKNEEYRNKEEHEKQLYNELMKMIEELPEQLEQDKFLQDLFSDYNDAKLETELTLIAICYKQGLRDMYTLIKSLS